MTRMLLAGTAAFALLAGCAHKPPATAAQQHRHSGDMSRQHGDKMANCPMQVTGTQVSSAEAMNGQTITFTTSPDQVGELRRRVHAMASTHNEKHASLYGPMGAGMKDGGAMSGGVMGRDKAMDKIPPSQATVSEVEQGASVTVTATDPNDLQKLRTAVQMHVQHMQKHECAMMGHGHQGPG